MSNFGPAPSLITRKISPSVDPRSHFASVRSGGCVSFGAIGPFPFASALWQNLQYLPNAAAPALIDSGDDATGFFNFFPASLPPGSCAEAERPTSTTHVRMTRNRKPFGTRRMMDKSPSEMRPILTQSFRILQTTGRAETSTNDRNRDFLV